MNEELENKPSLNSTINYCCNRFLPPLIIGFVMFLTMGVSSWVPWTICGLVLFMDKNVFKVGYSVGYVDKSEGSAPNL
jgi:hypothetical protein